MGRTAKSKTGGVRNDVMRHISHGRPSESNIGRSSLRHTRSSLSKLVSSLSICKIHLGVTQGVLFVRALPGFCLLIAVNNGQ